MLLVNIMNEIMIKTLMFVDTLYNPPSSNIDDSFNSMYNLSAVSGMKTNNQ